jgi:hypothetical protein
LRSCVLSRRSATPSHRACFACATLALVLTLTHSLSLSPSLHSCVRVCSREAYNPHSFRFVVRFRETTSSLSQWFRVEVALLVSPPLASSCPTPFPNPPRMGRLRWAP